VLDPVLGLAPALANALGYLVGMTVGFALNRTFVFRSRAALPAASLRYVIAAASAFLLNQAALGGAGALLGSGAPQRLTAQIIAMAVYSLALFAMCRLWVFKPAATSNAI
jgi:putative flippase GtrA